jgi:PAS domain S-box-containing protein
VISSLDGPAVVVDRDGFIIAANDEWNAISNSQGGVLEATSLGANYLRSCGTDHRSFDHSAKAAVEGIASVLNGTSPVFKLQYECEFPSGPIRYLMVVKRLREPIGGALIVHHNITEYGELDFEAVETVAVELRNILDLIPALVSFVAPDMRFRIVNRAFTEWFGIEEGKLIGRHIQEIFGETALEELSPEFANVLNGESALFERSITFNTAGEKVVRGRFIPSFDSSGQISGFVLLIVDRTEYYEAEVELKHSEERFTKLFNQFPLSSSISSLKDGRYIAVNDNLVANFGLSREQLIGKKGNELGIQMAPEAVENFYQAIREDNGVVKGFETELIHPNGETRTVLLAAVVLEIDGEQMIAVSAQDISERKKNETALQTLTTRLLSLQDAERRRIARELHDTTAQKISAVLLNLAVLKRTLPAKSKQIFEVLAESVLLAEESLGEIRTLSYVLHPPLLDQSGLVAALKWYIDGFTKRSGISVELAFAGSNERLPAEMEAALFRIVQEMLTNVHRHSQSKRAFIFYDRGSNEVTLRVRDEGIGIVASESDSAPDEIEGLGVGIMGMRERLRQFGGNLSIRGGNDGTTITARIPL